MFPKSCALNRTTVLEGKKKKKKKPTKNSVSLSGVSVMLYYKCSNTCTHRKVCVTNAKNIHKRFRFE